MDRVLYITNGITGAAGLERVLSVKCSMLADQFDYEVHVLSLNECNQEPFFRFSKRVCFHSIEVQGNPIKKAWSYIRGVQRVVDSIGPRVLCVCDNGLKAFFLRHAIKGQFAFVYERHSTKDVNFGEKTRFQRFIGGVSLVVMAFLGRFFDRFVVLTDGHVDEWPGIKCSVIPNPLPFRCSIPAPLENQRVVAVGRQAYPKGYDQLLKIWARVAKRHPEWVLAIYGKIDDSLGLEETARSLGVLNSVEFHPPSADIKAVYLEASVFVLSSLYEGFGMVLIEAMECGLPCVSFNCPFGPADIISNGIDGFLINPGDLEAFSEKLSLLLGDKPLRKEMGSNAKENVNRFDAEHVVQMWHELFQSI